MKTTLFGVSLFYQLNMLYVVAISFILVISISKIVLIVTDEVSVFQSCTAVNYVAVAGALDVSPSVLAAGLAADNVICAVYFTTLFALASKIPPEPSSSTKGV